MAVNDTYTRLISMDTPVGASGLVIDSNILRKYLILVNDSDTNMYLNLGTEAAETNKGIRLNANGGSYEINLTNPFTGPVHVYCSAAKRLTGVELSYA